jgi:membrane fusion protein, multidrug efflux system
MKKRIDGKQGLSEEVMRRNRIVSVVLLSVVVIFSGLTSCGKKEEKAFEKSAPVQGLKTEVVKSGPVDEDYEAMGTVRSKTTSVLSSKNTGHILAIRAREGDRVRKGQLLAEIDDRDTQAQLRKAQAGLREVNDALQEIEENIRAAEAAVDAAEAGKVLAIATFERYKALLERASISRQQFDEVQAKLKISEAEKSRAEKTLEAVISRKNQVKARMDQAKEDLIAAQVYVGYSRILSPINGIVASKQADIGVLAAPGVALFTIEDDSHYRLEVSVEDSILKRIRVDAPVRICIDALGPEKVLSRIGEIVPASDPGSRSSIIKLDLAGMKENAGLPILRSGLYGKACFPVGQKQNLRIPQKAVLNQGQLTGVYVVDPSSVVRLRLIKTGRDYGDLLEVLSGLNDGERIVVEGMDRIKEGDRVT